MSGYLKRSAWFVVASLDCLLLTLSAQAASFNCAKTQTKVEKFICADSKLSKLDEELNAAYKTALHDEKLADFVRQKQKQWIKARNDCSDAVCVKHSYENRMLSFQTVDSVSVTSSVEANDSDYVRDFAARTYLPAHVDRQDGEPYADARDPNICSLFLQNLQYFARRNMPMSCGQPIAPGLEKNIQKVEWEDLDPDKYSELFRELVRQDYVYYQREPTEQELAKAREFIRSKKGVFRRAKLDLKGYPSFKYVVGSNPAEAKFNLIQEGPNYTDPNNPEPLFRCEIRQGRVMVNGNSPSLLIATDNLRKFYWNSISSMGGSVQNLWLINNYLYAEWYGGDGTVQLSELRVESPIHFEPVCLYHYKTNLTNSGAKK